MRLLQVQGHGILLSFRIDRGMFAQFILTLALDI